MKPLVIALAADDDRLAQAASRVLIRCGHTVVPASGPEEGGFYAHHLDADVLLVQRGAQAPNHPGYRVVQFGVQRADGAWTFDEDELVRRVEQGT